jgi:hypothetical protein
MHEHDVGALATALDDALPDIPDIDPDSRSTSPRCSTCSEIVAYWVERDGPVFNVVAELGGPNKGGLRDFIAHCREGGEIWIC